MAAQATWVGDLPKTLEIENAASIVGTDGDELADRIFPGIIGKSPALRDLLDMVRIVAPTDATVLLNGETGTGKELIAEAIHKSSDRANGPFVKVNCAAIPSGLLESELFGHERGAFTGAITRSIGRFERANRGTLLLDEIGDLPLELQPKLLRVMQERQFERLGGAGTVHTDVRVICATHRNLAQMVDERQFRADLLYRLSVFPIELPPLRNRRGDIELLAGHFLDEYSKKLGKEVLSFSEEAMGLFMRYDWPGNVRQLQNAIQFALIKCRDRQIRPLHLPSEITDTVIVSTGMPKIKGKAGRHPKLSADAVDQALARAGGNKAKAARILGVGRATLYNFLNEHPEGRDHRA